MNVRAEHLAFPPTYDVVPVKSGTHHRRLDIQILRAFAILLVLIHHARIPFVPGGFLGVDVFFVISGYLMTGIIARDIYKNTFSLVRFYKVRARRLLPAAYCTLIITSIFAPFVLDSFGFHDFFQQLIGSFGFFVNFVLWHQTDYFRQEADLAPLLHMWSLAVEEQFYVAAPLILVLIPARLHLLVVGTLTTASLAACLLLLPRSPTAVFYLMPFRAWELGLGGIIALLVHHEVLKPFNGVALRCISATCLIVTPLLVNEQGHPGMPALLICMATAMLMIPGLSLQANPLIAPFKAIGDRSYSMYLVHWPLFAFANNLYLGLAPPAVNILLLALCLPLSFLQYARVEQRFMSLSVNHRAITVLMIVPLIVIAASFSVSKFMGPLDSGRSGNRGLASDCSYKSSYLPRRDCRTTPEPSTFLWGDSFAMHLAQGLAATSPGGIEQGTQPVCGPVLGLAPLEERGMPAKSAQTCIAFNDKVFAHIANSPNIKTVVLSSSLAQYVPGAEPVTWRYLRRDGTALRDAPASLPVLTAHLRDTVERLRQAGKRVILFGPIPTPIFDHARCVERAREGKLNLGRFADCRVTASADDKHNRAIDDYVASLSASGIVPVYDVRSTLCTGPECLAMVNGRSIYGARDHLSAYGSEMLGRQFAWGEIVDSRAR